MTLAVRGGTSCSIFVGNVPYDADEEELKVLFNKVVPVNSVRLVVDRDTKAPKGFAFCDLQEGTAVKAAIEKLNNIEYNGRKLRVDNAERALSGAPGREGEGPRPPRGGAKPPMPEPPMIPIPQLTPQERQARLKEQEAAEQARVQAVETAERVEIARLMETLSPPQVFHILGEFQRLAIQEPGVARALIGENLQLALALQHAQFLAGIIEEPALPTDAAVKERAKSVREQVWQNSPPILPLTQQQLQEQQQRAQQQHTSMLVASTQPIVVPQLAVPQVAAPVMVRGPAPVPSPKATQVGANTIPNVDMLAPGAPAQSEEQRKALLDRLVQLSPAQIDQLPTHAKVQLLEFLSSVPAAS